MSFKKFGNITAYIIISILLWQLFAFLYNSPFFPTPVDVFKSVVRLLSHKENYEHILVTMYRILIALPITMLLGSIFGILPRYSKQAKYFVESIIYPLFQAVPPASWILLFAVWLGLLSAAPIVATSLIALPYVIIPISKGMKELDETLIELGLSFTKKRMKIFKHIIIPLLYPYFFTAFRTCFGFTCRFIVVAELFLALSGIGYMMGVARELFDMTTILAWTICMMIIIVFFEYGVFNYIEKKTLGKGKHD